MNRLSGTISDLDVHGSIALVEVLVGDRTFTATLIGASEEVAGWQRGTPVTLLFKETEVSLAKNLSGLISMRNRMPCTVTAIERGKLLARITLDFEGRKLESIITARSSHTLGLAIGDMVEGLVKANEMTLVMEDVE